MGNTLGAIVFLAAGTWLGWTVISGKAQNFLSAMGSRSGNSGAGGKSGTLPPAPTSPPLGGYAGGGFNFGDQLDPLSTPIPNVFQDVFGQNGSLNGPGYTGEYGAYSPNESGSFVPPEANLSYPIFQGAFGIP